MSSELRDNESLPVRSNDLLHRSVGSSHPGLSPNAMFRSWRTGFAHADRDVEAFNGGTVVVMSAHGCSKCEVLVSAHRGDHRSPMFAEIRTAPPA